MSVSQITGENHLQGCYTDQNFIPSHSLLIIKQEFNKHNRLYQYFSFFSNNLPIEVNVIFSEENYRNISIIYEFKH